MAEVLKRLGSRHVLVVHAADGLDEFSIGAFTRVAELKDGSIAVYTVAPEELGLTRASIASLRVNSVEQSLQKMHNVLEGIPGPARDIVVLNAGAALYTAGVSDSLQQGLAMAVESIATGAAKARLEALVRLSRNL